MSGRPLPSSFDENEDFYNESGFSKVLRRLKQEPLVPIGCILTVAAFTNAYRAMRRGDHQGVQRMFRARVAAQAFTVMAMVAGGMYYSTERHRERELWKLQQQREAEEKRQRWIKELEFRDEEDRAVRERLDKRRKKAEGKRTEVDADGAASVSEAVARAATAAKGNQEAEQASGDAKSKVIAQAEAGGEPVSVENKEGTSFFGSLGGLFGGSRGSAVMPNDPRSDAKGQKADAEATKK